MAKINLTITDSVVTGKQVSFIAPCACRDATCLLINGVDYTLVDAFNTDISGTDAWVAGAMVSVILNVEESKAYVQNSASVIAGGESSVPIEEMSMVRKTVQGTSYLLAEDIIDIEHKAELLLEGSFIGGVEGINVNKYSVNLFNNLHLREVGSMSGTGGTTVSYSEDDDEILLNGSCEQSGRIVIPCYVGHPLYNETHDIVLTNRGAGAYFTLSNSSEEIYLGTSESYVIPKGTLKNIDFCSGDGFGGDAFNIYIRIPVTRASSYDNVAFRFSANLGTVPLPFVKYGIEDTINYYSPTTPRIVEVSLCSDYRILEVIDMDAYMQELPQPTDIATKLTYLGYSKGGYTSVKGKAGQVLVADSVDSVGRPITWSMQDLPSDEHIQSLIDKSLGDVSATLDEINGEVV